MSVHQVGKLLDAGVEAAKWNSSTSEQSKSRLVGEIVASPPDLRLLYTTPESLRKPQLRDALKVRPALGGGSMGGAAAWRWGACDIGREWVHGGAGSACRGSERMGATCRRVAPPNSQPSLPLPQNDHTVTSTHNRRRTPPARSARLRST